VHTVGCGTDGQDEDVDQGDVDRRQTEDDNTDGDEEGIVEDPPAPRKSQRSGITRAESEVIKAKLRSFNLSPSLRTRAAAVLDKGTGPGRRRAVDAAAAKVEKIHKRLRTQTCSSPTFKKHVQRIRQMPVVENGVLTSVLRHKAGKEVKIPKAGAVLFERYDIKTGQIKCDDGEDRHIVHVIRYNKARVPSKNTQKRLWKGGMALLTTIQDIDERPVIDNPPVLMYPRVYVQVCEPGKIPTATNEALNKYNKRYPYLESCGLKRNMDGAIVFCTDEKVSTKAT